MKPYSDPTAWKALGHIEKKRRQRHRGEKKQRLQIRYARYFEEAENGKNVVLPGVPSDDGASRDRLL